jgi:GH15 family glucan-1,4-alpha-glucosidase
VARSQPSIGDYGLIGDGRAAALVSKGGSIDWCCLPRFDAGSCFARVLDWESGGYCAVAPRQAPDETFQTYHEDTLVLQTTFRCAGGEATVHDFFARDGGEAPSGPPRLVRVIEGRRGTTTLDLALAARFDYGLIEPWLRRRGRRTFAATGGDDGLLIWSDIELDISERDQLRGEIAVRAGERRRLVITAMAPEEIDRLGRDELEPEVADRALDETLAWWRRWAQRLDTGLPPAVRRSALTLKALIHDPTGAQVAAPTTSLPEVPGGGRNWDYRYAWIRDCTFAVRAMAEIGCPEEADDFRAFIERTAAGSARDLRVMYGVGGEHMLAEMELDHLAGYRGAQPVRVGNGAHDQFQLDVYGELLEQSWRWHRRGNSPDDDYWRFLRDLVDVAVERWREPDRGLWEWRGDPLPFTYSKAMAWVAADRGLRIADECLRRAPTRRWRAARERIKRTVERDAYDKQRGIFTAVLRGGGLDAALLRLPIVEFVEAEDERMVRTVDAIVSELDDGGLLHRHNLDDSLEGEEGAFLACTFWLATCLAEQGRVDDARAAFERASATANHLGLFAEEYDPGAREPLGNFPQALTHLSHVEASVALARAESVVQTA